MAPSSKFWDRIAERYARKPVGDEAAYQTKLQTTRQYCRPDMAVLELGCGTGSTAVAQAPYVKHILATDLSAKMLEIAQGKADSQGIENITFQQSSLEALDLPPGSMDVVMAHSLLHLLEDKDAAVAKIHGWLKPGGAFVSSTACLGDTMGFFRVLAPIGHFLGLIPLVKVFTTAELKQSLTAAGFAIDHAWQPGKGKSLFLVALKR